MSEPTVTQTQEGHEIEFSGKRSWGDKRTIKIDRLWVVEIDGQIIGHIRYRLLTREQRTPGRRYVNSRWQSPGWEYQESSEPYTSIYSGKSYWGEATSKKQAVENLVWQHTRKSTTR